MSEYIKKEDAIESARALLFCYGSDNIPEEQLDEYAEEFINDDDNTIVEVVRCKDCKHRINYSDGDGWYCDVTNNCLMRDENFYCSYGERKDNGERVESEDGVQLSEDTCLSGVQAERQ